MNGKKKRILATMISIILLCALPAVCGCQQEERESAIILPDKKIETVQINGMKVHANESSKWGDFETFAQSLESLLPLEDSQKKIERGENYSVINLIYEDRTKERFYFFQVDDVWYVESEDGTIFRNADFVKEYINLPSQIPVENTSLSGELELLNPSEIKKMIELHIRLKERGVLYSEKDLRAAFVIEMQNQLLLYAAEQEAVQAARQSLTGKMDQYQYTVSEGLSLSEEELDKQLDEQANRVKSAENFSELESYFKEYGTSYEEYEKDRREYSRIQLTIEKLYQAAYEEFRHGNDQIGDKICEDFNEYWTYFLLEVVYPAQKTYNEQELSPLLDEAENFYFEFVTSETEQLIQK